jgi:hypothetical protein
MDWRFDASREALEDLERTVSEIPGIQRTLVTNHAALHRMDRAAHQQQIGAGKVVFEAASQLPGELTGRGLFHPGLSATGLGRISTGLGCPHLETDPDFLGLMLAFQTRARERVDFLGINDPSAPTDTVAEFVALLAATAAAAGAKIPFGGVGRLDIGNLTVAQARLFHALAKRLGFVRAAGIYLHIARQTARTAMSSSAVQRYWTGVVEAGTTLGKFTLVPDPEIHEPRSLRPGARHLSEDWERRSRAANLVFAVRWVPFVNEKETPLVKLSKRWSEAGAMPVGTVTFIRAEVGSREERLLALLASEMGANPGHWVSGREGEPGREFPVTTFAAGRKLAYALSQKSRGALPEASYQEFFDGRGTIGPALEAELLRRHQQKGLEQEASATQAFQESGPEAATKRRPDMGK